MISRFRSTEDSPETRARSLPRRSFLLLGVLAAVGCGDNKDTPETKALMPDNERAKDSMDYMRAQMQKKGKRR